MIIGISGKKGHGKDTIAKMIQYFTSSGMLNVPNWKYLGKPTEWVDIMMKDRPEYFTLDGKWQNKKFAGKLKQIVSILIGCTVENLENEEFKSKELGEEWSCYLIPGEENRLPTIFPIDVDIEWIANGEKYFKRKMTPRMLLQLLGTECGRQIIHPNIWINGLMSEYTKQHYLSYDIDTEKVEAKYVNNGFPNWIISDVRFPDEAEAIKDKGGLVVRVNNSRVGWTGNHESETAMDNYFSFDKIFDNSSTLGDLQGQVKEFLENYKLI